MRSGTFALLAVAISSSPLVSCRRDDARIPERIGASASAVARTDISPPNSGAFRAHRPAELDEAAKQIVAFLRGEVGFDRIRLADTVTLYVSPEGGGTRAVRTRALLRDRSNWKVRGQGKAAYSLVPPNGMSKLTTRVGRHFDCHEYPLASRFLELAQLPHVGTKLEPADASSCLQTWNLTLVFDPNERPPTLVAAVYDQWEW
jgi:hypothetical protein